MGFPDVPQPRRVRLVQPGKADLPLDYYFDRYEQELPHPPHAATAIWLVVCPSDVVPTTQMEIAADLPARCALRLPTAWEGVIVTAPTGYGRPKREPSAS